MIYTVKKMSASPNCIIKLIYTVKNVVPIQVGDALHELQTNRAKKRNVMPKPPLPEEQQNSEMAKDVRRYREYHHHWLNGCISNCYLWQAANHDTDHAMMNGSVQPFLISYLSIWRTVVF